MLSVILQQLSFLFSMVQLAEIYSSSVQNIIQRVWNLGLFHFPPKMCSVFFRSEIQFIIFIHFVVLASISGLLGHVEESMDDLFMHFLAMHLRVNVCNDCQNDLNWPCCCVVLYLVMFVDKNHQCIKSHLDMLI